MTDTNAAQNPMTRMPYLTAGIPGIGGTIRMFAEDFLVEEVPLYEPIDEGTHVFFCIEKRHLDTLRAIRAIAEALGRRPFEIGMAGLKDARAVTRQILSIEHVDPAVVQNLQIPDIHVLWTRRHRNKLKLGHLKGNRFAIKLRNVDPARRNDAQATLDILVKRGVPNYFGPQRFGVRGDTWEIGRAIVKQDDKEAIDVLAGRPSEFDPPLVRKARELYEAGQYYEASKTWPYTYREERIAVKAMLKNKGNHRRALSAVDRSVKRLYVSAFQSYLFNRILAERVRLGAMDHLWQGDLAWLHDRGAVFLVEDPASEQPRADRLEISPTGPLFGSRTTIAQGRPGQMETQLLASEQITPEDFRQIKGQKVRGARRPLRFPLSEFEFDSASDEHGPYFALKFFLPSGCYATSLLRELCKSDVRKIDAAGEGIDEEVEDAED